MAIDPSTFPETPHAVTWQPKKDGTRGGSANDGKEDSDTSPADITVFLDPKPAVWAERAYGIVVERQAYLVIGRVDDMRKMVKGDELQFGNITLVVEMKPQIFPPFRGFEHGETIATEMKTGGRP